MVAACLLLVVSGAAVTWKLVRSSNQDSSASLSETVSQNKDLKIPTRDQERSSREQPATELRVRVWRNGEIDVLLKFAPVTSGDRFEIRADVPANLHVTLFTMDGAGHLRALDSRLPARVGYEYRFPSNPKDYQEIVGGAQTEFVILCGSERGPVAANDLEASGIFGEPLPKLSDETVIVLRSDAVEFLRRGRDIGGSVETLDPNQAAFERIQRMRSELLEIVEFVSGAAFPHTENP